MTGRVCPVHYWQQDRDNTGDRCPWCVAIERQAKIDDGICPNLGCVGSLDESLYCKSCGIVARVNVPQAEYPRIRPEPPYTPPAPVDEFAPAQCDEAA